MNLLALILNLSISKDSSAFICHRILLHPGTQTPDRLNMQAQGPTDSPSPCTKKRGARVAFVGNSIQYFNDTPRFLSRLSRQPGFNPPLLNKSYNAFIECQDSCFRGGVSLVGLWEQGNGMQKHGFASDTAIIGTDEHGANVYDVGAPTVESLIGQKQWDFVVINDHTQGPARGDTRDATMDILVNKYAPLMIKCNAVPIIIETAAYRLERINDSQDLGTTQEFQMKVREGILKYINSLKNELRPTLSPRIAPVGMAYLHVKQNNFALWEQLFDSFDNFHPSPKGTFLQGCVLYYTMFSCSPPMPSTNKEIVDLWRDARFMNSANGREGYEIMALPTVDEANYLCGVAELICQREAAERSKSNL